MLNHLGNSVTVLKWAQSWSDVTAHALCTAQATVVLPQPSSWEQCRQGDARQGPEFMPCICGCIMVREAGDVSPSSISSAWLPQTSVLSLNSCKQLLTVPSISTHKNLSSLQDTSGIFGLHRYCPQFYSMLSTVSSISRKKNSSSPLGPITPVSASRHCAVFCSHS